MSFESTKRAGRIRRLELMKSTCVITRPGERVFNSETGQYDDGDAEVVYDGRCHFRAWSGMGARTGDVAGREMVGTLYDLALPHQVDDGPAVSVSDTVTLTRCDAEWAVGIPFPVVSVEHSDDRNAQHLTVTDQARGTVDYA